MQSINVEPGIIQIALKQLMNYEQTHDYSINKDSLTKVLNNLIITHAPLNHGSEVAWAVWSCMILNIKINPVKLMLKNGFPLKTKMIM